MSEILAHESAAASEELSARAVELKSMLEKFNLKNDSNRRRLYFNEQSNSKKIARAR